MFLLRFGITRDRHAPDGCRSEVRTASAAGNMPVDRIAPDPARDSLAKLALKSGLPWNKGELAALFHECKSTAGEVHATNEPTLEIGRASCRERVCQYV